MRWKALLVVGMMIVSGCISPGSGETQDQGQTIDPSSAGDETANASSNATYLKNSDYNETHVHDYWPGNATEKVLMDETVSTWTSIHIDGSYGGTWFSLPNGSFVPQGTGLLVVEIDATGALKNGQQQLEYKAADEGRYKPMEPKDAQATWEIDVSPEMTDPPHSKSTRWAFLLDAEGPGSVMNGEINVKITAQKLHDLEAWPEHPDFWDGGNLTKLHLANINATYDEQETFVQESMERRPEDAPINFSEGTIVPPETKVLLVKFWYERADDPKNNFNADVNLRVKEGAWASWWGWQEWRVVREEPGYKMYAIPVDGASWDSPYTEQSAWSFMIELPSGLRNPTGSGTLLYLSGPAEIGAGNVTIDATAYRVIPPWLGSMMEEEGIGSDRSARQR